mgnify:CR=1 FL=1
MPGPVHTAHTRVGGGGTMAQPTSDTEPGLDPVAEESEGARQ